MHNQSKRKAWKKALLVFLFITIAYLILALKLSTFDSWNFVYIYSIFVTTFMFSRIGGSFFYESYVKKKAKKKNITYLFSAMFPFMKFKNFENEASSEPKINY